MDGVDVPFDKVQELPSRTDLRPHQAELPGKRRRRCRSTCSARAGARSTSLPELERDLGVPVVHPVTARAWEIQKRLHIRKPVTGYGRLLADPAVREMSMTTMGGRIAGAILLGALLAAARHGAIGRAVLQGPHGHADRRLRAGRHQRHLRPASSARHLGRFIPGNPDDRGAEHARRRRARRRQPPLQRRREGRLGDRGPRPLGAAARHPGRAERRASIRRSSPGSAACRPTPTTPTCMTVIARHPAQDHRRRQQAGHGASISAPTAPARPTWCSR